jgi:hypothetical protein
MWKLSDRESPGSVGLKFLLNAMRQQSVDDFSMIRDRCIRSMGSEEWTVRES